MPSDLVTPAFLRTMAACNEIMNRRLHESAARLSDVAWHVWRVLDSRITFNHLLWADRVRTSRFDGWEKPGGRAGRLPGAVSARLLFLAAANPLWSGAACNRGSIGAKGNRVVRGHVAARRVWRCGLFRPASVQRPRALGIRACARAACRAKHRARGSVHCSAPAAGAGPDGGRGTVVRRFSAAKCGCRLRADRRVRVRRKRTCEGCRGCRFRWRRSRARPRPDLPELRLLVSGAWWRLSRAATTSGPRTAWRGNSATTGRDSSRVGRMSRSPAFDRSRVPGS